MKKRSSKKISITNRPLHDVCHVSQLRVIHDLVFDRPVTGRSIKSLTALDSRTHEAAAIVPKHELGRIQQMRILEQMANADSLSREIRTDTGKRFYCRALLTSLHARGVKLSLIELGRLNQNAHIKLFNGRFIGEGLN